MSHVSNRTNINKSSVHNPRLEIHVTSQAQCDKNQTQIQLQGTVNVQSIKPYKFFLVPLQITIQSSRSLNFSKSCFQAWAEIRALKNFIGVLQHSRWFTVWCFFYKESERGLKPSKTLFWQEPSHHTSNKQNLTWQNYDGLNTEI